MEATDLELVDCNSCSNGYIYYEGYSPFPCALCDAKGVLIAKYLATVHGIKRYQFYKLGERV